MATHPSAPRNPAPSQPKRRDDDARGAKPGTGMIVPPHGGRIGQAPHIPTEVSRMQCKSLAGFCTQRTIAAKMGISYSTLIKHYRNELDDGAADVRSAIGGKIVQQALKGDRASQFFYMRTFGGWGPKALVEVTGPGGGPIQHAHATVDFSAFLAGKSPDELRLLLPIVDQLIAFAGGADLDPDGVGFEGADIEGDYRSGDGGDEGES